MTDPNIVNDKAEVENAVLTWKKFLADIDPAELIATATEAPEVSDAGDVYFVVTPEDLPGDFAVVDMRRLAVDVPEMHIDETEIHLPLAGEARMSVGEDVVDLEAGDAQVVNPGTPHFVIPDNEYIVGVLSIPGFDPEHQQLIDVNDPPEGFNADLYFAALR